MFGASSMDTCPQLSSSIGSSMASSTTMLDAEMKNENQDEGISDKWALQMMQKMGYQLGTGLGKNKQGIKSAVDVKSHLGRRGLGLQVNHLNLSDELWDFDNEDLIVQEKVDWLENDSQLNELTDGLLNTWLVEGAPESTIGCHFCNDNIVREVFNAKEIFNELDAHELNIARSKANPFETVKSVFFMNRAALKMANIDAATDFAFTNIEDNDNFKNQRGPIYFADVCAGPGGFTEYILWRKQWKYKGFGLTLKEGQNDFRVHESTCAPSATFQALYGKNDDGDVCNPDNLVDFIDKVKHESCGHGLHFIMSDGGFSVDGNEGLQEILSKNIYICQCFLALKVLRPHGLFVTKLFDVFTPFSVGLLFLMYMCFKKVGIIKPKSSRPANSERYFVCYDFQENTRTASIREFLWNVVNKLWNYKDKDDIDVIELVPLDVLLRENMFYSYIKKVNNRIGANQIIALKKLATFCRNPKLIDVRQHIMRGKCLEYWKIPDLPKKASNVDHIDNLLGEINITPDILRVQPREIETIQSLDITLNDLNDWVYAIMSNKKNSNRSAIYAGISNHKVYRLSNKKWMKVRNTDLVPGTLLYGEFVKEYINSVEENTYRYSLHVIDALSLGGQNLQRMNFHQRSELIDLYCKAVNRESEKNKYLLRIRHKPLSKLSDIYSNCDIMPGIQNCRMMPLSTLGYGANSESFEANSILLMRVNQGQSFQSSYVLRAQIYMDYEEDKDDIFKALLNHVRQNLNKEINS